MANGRVHGIGVGGLGLFLAALLTAARCGAAIVDGRETFQGTGVDYATWLAYSRSLITQNAGLTIDTYAGGRAQLTMRQAVFSKQVIRVGWSFPGSGPVEMARSTWC